MGHEISTTLHLWAYGQENVEYDSSYVYLGVVFTRPMFSRRGVATTRLTRGYAALGSLERMCSHVQF